VPHDDDLMSREEIAEKSKPHPDIFEAALKRLGSIDSSRVLVIGDIPHDAEAASQANIRMIGVLCGDFPEADPQAATPGKEAWVQE
jgi:beta-phosphoglucomutase-like phosphatase (HAD superfamily)